MSGILDREGADAAGAGMDQDALARARAGALKPLQRGQPHQRQRRRFRVRDAGGLEGDEFFGKRDLFGKAADGVARRAGIDLVARLELVGAGAHGEHDTAGVEAERPRQLVFRDPLQRAVHQLEVDRIEAGGMDFDQGLAGTRHRTRNLPKPDIVRDGAIAAKKECAHRCS